MTTKRIGKHAAWRLGRAKVGAKRALQFACGWIYRCRYCLPTKRISDFGDKPCQSSAPIMEDICLPPYYGSSEFQDFEALISIAQALNPRAVLELGTAHGNTVANLCIRFPDAHVFTVNALAEDQSGDKVTFTLTQDEIGRVYRERGFGDRVTQIFANTLDLDFSQYLSVEAVDLAIIDACHDTAFVVNDFIKVAPYIRSGGIVLLHDTHPIMTEFLIGSYVGCMKLRRRGYDIGHLAGTSWGIWQAP